MLDLTTAYKTQNEQFAEGVSCGDHNAIVLTFPYSLPKTAKQPRPVATGEDMIDRRMQAPLCSDEMRAVLEMVKYRAKQLGQELWVATGLFLVAMGVEELEELRRCDFVRAVEHLMPSTLSTQSAN
jgi:hypothetical protein